jgi:predicted Zn-ribbon and HTH transcriptional regulator|tara:strand:- start:415 stop:603 length:189 start_codon:yes stop_codon:yes gene_type:complete
MGDEANDYWHFQESEIYDYMSNGDSWSKRDRIRLIMHICKCEGCQHLFFEQGKVELKRLKGE